MGSASVDASVVVNAPLERVFERITDHEAMAKWPGIKSARLIAHGQPKNGLGAVRQVQAGGLTLREKVVSFEPPHSYQYQIIKGLPVKHLGTVKLTPVDGAVRVDWHIDLASPMPLFAQAVGFALRRGLPGALKFFAKSCEAP
jgi:uncharacterized protein YndB with AHSA1/START domain